ncbi:hypothetical protein ONS95_005117 [Cadophora gregata]|uniref:uncharacterized protein n=1 Tax=Cadophora gregata TaxID=51156 RepID=UPI0026DB464D|nr:uncharacterized protein ONS95_005117 [Cadophora gregata]KAK0104851.1 hypothetical protein ONS95_005117 [Cadophora gregata]KAK0115068.1 hypothetical protein ONS96_013538 [Cadophora gregata f. sp. sojae]
MSAQHATKQTLAAAHSQLAAALKSLDSIKRRNGLIHDFLDKTQNYQIANEDAEHRRILLRWILEQIPLIELELSQTKVAGTGSGVEDGKNKVKCSPIDDLDHERASKRRREDDGKHALSKHTSRISTVPTIPQHSSSMQWSPPTAGHEAPLKRKSHDATEEGRPNKQLKYSGQKSHIAEPEPLPTQSDKSEPDAAQAPKPRKRRAKVYQKVRQSRRIAGQSPQFGML